MAADTKSVRIRTNVMQYALIRDLGTANPSPPSSHNDGMRSRRTTHRGQIAPIAAIMIVPLVGFLGLGFDTATAAHAAERAQAVADSASLAGAFSMGTTGGIQATATSAIDQVTELNGYVDTEVTIRYCTDTVTPTCGTGGPSVVSVQVTMNHVTPTTFSGIFGFKSETAIRSSTANVGAAAAVGGGSAPAGGANVAGTTVCADEVACTLSSDPSDDTKMVGDRLLIPSPGESISTVEVTFDTATPNSHFEVAAYTDKPNSPEDGLAARPNTFIQATTTTLIVGAGTTTATFAPAVLLAPDTFYWLMVESDGANDQVQYYDNTTDTCCYNNAILSATVTPTLTHKLPGAYATGKAWTSPAAPAPGYSGSHSYFIVATFPVVGGYSANTLGYNIPLWWADRSEQNSIEGNHVYTGGSPFLVTSLSAYYTAKVCNSDHLFQMAIYADNNNAPTGAALATSSTGTIVASTWATVTMNLLLQPTSSYWILINNNGTCDPSQNNLAIGPQSNERGAYAKGTNTFGLWPATPGNWTTSAVVYSFYATGGVPGSPTLRL